MTSLQRHLTHASVLLALSVSASAQLQTRDIAEFTAPALDPDAVPSFSSSLPDAPDAQQSAQQSAQQPAPTPTPPPTPPPNETPEQKKAREQREEAEREVKEQEKQRIGAIIPNFNVRINGQGVPLTVKQKFEISFKTNTDPYTFALAILVGGGLGELEDSHTGYGHGPAGLGKRIGSSLADNVDGNLIGNAILPSILHQDPRYFRKGEGKIVSRVIYSALSTFICKGDNGKRQFNTSNVLGNFLAGEVSNLYYPNDERGTSLALQNALTVTLEGMLGAQLLEFSPDVTNYIHKRREHHRQVLAAQAASAQTNSQPAKTPPPATSAPPARTPQ